MIEDYTEEVIDRLHEVAWTALEAVGLQAEGDCQMACPVDTGLLRNSITHAVYGKPPSISSYQSNATHASSSATQNAGTAGKPVNPIQTGTYSGNVTDGSEEYKVFIGTNVEYAA